jgi:hypothetical protein
LVDGLPRLAMATATGDRYFMVGAAFATEFQNHPPATDEAHMAVAQSGQPVARIGSRIFGVAVGRIPTTESDASL